MISNLSASTDSSVSAIRERVLRAIACNRFPGLHFPGHFLDIKWKEVAGGTARATLEDGPHCRNANGAINLVALGIFADQVLAASVRTEAPPGVRLGTVHLHLQFTGTAAIGNIDAAALLQGRREGATLRQWLSSGTMYAQNKPICFANGEFLLLDPPPGAILGPLPWERPEPLSVAPVDIDKLEPHERAILKACDAALAKASPQAPFIQHFWGGAPRQNMQGASNSLAIGQHIGNRVGHVQGGALFGLAADTACAAAPKTMMLSNMSVWYISSGRGVKLRARSRILHAGRTTAVVRTEIKADGGKRVLEAVSHHVARK